MNASSADAGSQWFRARLAQLPTTAVRDDGRAAVVETAAMERGTMPPLHARDRDESYHVLEGEVVFYVGDETVRARAGEVVVVPSGTARTFLVTSATARWLVMTTVRSLSRYQDFTRAVTQPREIGGLEETTWPSAEEAASLAAIAAANGIHVLGPPGMLPSALDAVTASGP